MLLVLSISGCPDLFGGLWVIMTLVVWWWPRQTTTFSPGTWYGAKHGSQPIGSELYGWDKLLARCKPACWSSVPVPPPQRVELCLIFWHPWVGTRLVSLSLQHSSCQEENPRSGLTEGAVTELWWFLKLQSLVVLVGKWLPYSQVGGIPTFVKEPPLVAYKWIP